MKNWKKSSNSFFLFAIVFSLATVGCGHLENFSEPLNGDYHQLSYNAPAGVDMTIQRHATKAMVSFYDAKGKNTSNEAQAKSLLKIAFDEINKNAKGRARELWNGNYSIFGYHPNFGKGFRESEWNDLISAIRDMKTRNHECLCVTWTAGGTNWTTRNAGGKCGWGKKLK
jgi:hypothetical protein